MIRCVTVMNVLKSYQNAAFSGVQKESIYHESPAHQRQPPREGLHLYRTEPHRRGAERRRHRDGDLERRHKARGRLHRLRRLCRRQGLRLRRRGQRGHRESQDCRRLCLRHAGALRFRLRQHDQLHGPSRLRGRQVSGLQTRRHLLLGPPRRHHIHPRPAGEVPRVLPYAAGERLLLAHGPRLEP